MKLSIAYVNDVHGYLESHPELFYEGEKEFIKMAGGYAGIVSAINAIRESNPETLVFDGGDTFHGTLPLIESKGEAILPVLNKIGFSAMVGHWDFAYGPKQLKNLASQLNYPILGINVYRESGELFLKPYILTYVSEIKIAVIGICSNIIDKTMPKHFSDGLKITNGNDELPLYIKEVKEKGADLIILLSHNGFPQDMHMLSTIRGIDVCLSAHTHNRLYEAVKINNTIIIQCGCHGSFLGRLDLEIKQNKIYDFTYELITIDDSIPPDIETQAIVNEIMQPYRKLEDEIVGNTPTILHRYNGLESNMDNLMLSAIKYISKSEIAFSNGWRYGIPISKGIISKWDLFNVIPMNPKISILEITGAELLMLLEENLERTFSINPMKQMGGYIKRCLGLTIKMRIENPEGHRIQQIFIGNELLVKEKSYIASFVTSQGIPEKFGKNRRDIDITVITSIEQYLKQRLFEDVNNRSFCLV